MGAVLTKGNAPIVVISFKLTLPSNVARLLVRLTKSANIILDQLACFQVKCIESGYLFGKDALCLKVINKHYPAPQNEVFP